jgi:hypothetical protein
MSAKLTPVAGLTIQDVSPLSSTLVSTASVIDGNFDVGISIYGTGTGTGFANNSSVGVDLGTSVTYIVDTIIVRMTARNVGGDDEWQTGTNWWNQVYVYSSNDNSTWELLQYWGEPGSLAPLTADGGFLNHMTLTLTVPKIARYFKVHNAKTGVALGVWKQNYAGSELNATEMEVYGEAYNQRYWVGPTSGTPYFDDTANWSLTSGGTGGASVPTTGQTGVFDLTSGSRPVYIRTAVLCNLNTITGGNSHEFRVQTSGSLSLKEDLHCSYIITTGTGTITTNNYDVYVSSYISLDNDDSAFGTSTISMSAATYFSCPYAIDFSGCDLEIVFDSSGFSYNGTLTFKTVSLSGDCSNASMVSGSITIADASGLTIAGSTSGGLELNDFETIMASGTVSASNATLHGCTASGGATFNAFVANGNVNGGDNSGWAFNEIPAVTTSAGTDITNSGFTANGNVTDTGDLAITRRGFCYIAGAAGDPQIGDPGVLEVHEDDTDFGTGVYSLSVDGLIEGTNYRVRAYAINTQGTGYGSTVDVLLLGEVPDVTTQAATAILADSFTANGNITDAGGIDITRRGFCYVQATTGDPEIGGEGVLEVHEDGTFSEGAFDLPISSGIDYYLNYRVRAYAINDSGTGYGNTVDVLTLDIPVVLTTESSTDINFTTFRANGVIVSKGRSQVTRRGFCYLEGPTGTPTVADETKYEDGDFEVGELFYQIVSMLNSNYRVRAYAINSLGVNYGNTVGTSTVILESLTVTPILPLLEIGETTQLQVLANYTDGTSPDVTGSCTYVEEDYAIYEEIIGAAGTYEFVLSSGTTVASVDSSGLVAALSGGIAKIKISFETIVDFVHYILTQTVDSAIEYGGAWDGEVPPGTVVPDLSYIEIVLDKDVIVGTSQQARIIGYFNDSPETSEEINPTLVTWISSNTAVATVDSNGLVVAISAGVTFIRATYEVLDSPAQEFTTVFMMSVYDVEINTDNPYQYIPLKPTPNQNFRCVVSVDATTRVSIDFKLVWNEYSDCWEMSLKNSNTGEYYVDPIPLYAGRYPTHNLLGQHQYLNIGSCYILNISNLPEEKPNLTNLGIDYILVWGYTE